ncbi:MAG: hypothetical protein LIO85_00680 [Rikenellaceae bacterium]|nr:hypothetical protein [Rikenellaceae bacterium]MCC8174243.1 hypothetical protein [Odoribacter sp.]
MLFITDPTLGWEFAPYYLVRVTDGKVYEFGNFTLNVIYFEDGDYLYCNAIITEATKIIYHDNGDISAVAPTPLVSGVSRLYLPSNGSPTVEELSTYQNICLNVFTRDYYGANGYLLTNKTTNRSFIFSADISGIDYQQNIIYSGFGHEIQEYHITEYGLEKGITIVHNEPYPVMFTLAHHNDVYMAHTDDEIRHFNKATQATSNCGKLITMNGSAGSRHQFNEYKSDIRTDNAIHIADFTQNTLDDTIYTLIEFSNYPEYRITNIKYNPGSDKYYIDAIRLSDTKQVLLSIEAIPGAELIEEQEFVNNITYLVPIN